MTDNEYEAILGYAVENAEDLLSASPELRDNEDEFHERLFKAVLRDCDEGIGPVYVKHIEALEISRICSEVEGDVIHGDILGL